MADSMEIKYGVTQGSVLCPFLYLLHRHNLPINIQGQKRFWLLMIHIF